MTRTLVSALILTATLASPSFAQEWAKKMFEVTSHDFGIVARGSKQIFEFELQNKYKEDIHISSVRTSCNCTIPSIKKKTLKTWETGAIIAEYNTRSFLGKRGATVTVTIDKPYFAEVQLSVKGYIRSDVVFNPSSIQFGEIDMGSGGEKTIDVNYAGRANWKITDVRSGNEHLQVSLDETQRVGNRVSYKMTVKLSPQAPAGFLQDQLTLVTDDNRLKSVAVAVEGRVKTPLTVSPASLFLGTLKPGESVTKKLVVRSKQPFVIAKVNCADKRFQFDVPQNAKALHLLPFTFTADANPGKVSQTIEIVTGIGAGTSASCLVTGEISGPAVVAGN